MSNRSQTGFAAELFVAAELAKQGHLVTITWGNEKAIDLLVSKDGNPKKTVSIDVKGLKKPDPWALGNFRNKKKYADVYIFCHLNKPNEKPEYFIVPRTKLKEPLVGYARDRKSAWIYFNDVRKYKDRWDLIWGGANICLPRNRSV